MKIYPDPSAWIKAIAWKHLGANIRGYKWLTWLGAPKENSFGGLSFIRPQEGKVVDMDDDLVLIKTKPSEFCVVAKDLLAMPVELNSNVKLTFYDLRDFDGRKSDGSEDPSEDGCRSMMLTGAKTYFPVIWEGRYPRRAKAVKANWTPIHNNPYLQDLIQQMEGISAGKGRNLVNVLVDAKGSNPVFFDPPEDESCHEDHSKWPSITTTVNSGKFSGQVVIRYDRAADDYEIILTPNEGAEIAHTRVYFDDLEPTLVEAIEDGSWQQIKVEVLKAAPKVKPQKLTAA